MGNWIWNQADAGFLRGQYTIKCICGNAEHPKISQDNWMEMFYSHLSQSEAFYRVQHNISDREEGKSDLEDQEKE